MAKLGTLAWMAKSHGAVGVREKLAMAADGVKARAATQARIRRGEKIRYREVEEIVPPDSAIAREAMAMCEDASEPFLFNHCMRAYYWARLLDDGGKPFDDEAVFVALMLHDMGLTERYRLTPDSREKCFTIIGAQLVERLAQAHRWSDRRAALAAEAITLHLNVVVDDSHGKEAQMVRAGSGGDVAGLGMDVLYKDQIVAVCSCHPRLHMKQNMCRPLDIEARQRPESRIAYLNNKLGMRELIGQAPMFEE